MLRFVSFCVVCLMLMGCSSPGPGPSTYSDSGTTEAPPASDAAATTTAGTTDTATTEPTTTEPATKELTTTESATKESATKESATKESASKDAATSEPAAKEPAAKEPAAKESPAKEPAAKEPAAKEPAATESPAKEPAATKEPPAAAPTTDAAPAPKSDAAAQTTSLVPLESGAATLNSSNTTIQFVGKHNGDQPDRLGVFTDFAGNITVDPAAKTLKSVTAEFKTSSLQTAFPKLTTHLSSPDFLDVREYPTAKFASTSVTQGDGAGKFNLVGNFTLMKATKEVTIPVQVNVTDAGLSLTGQFTIDRTEFGMVGQDGVKKEVDIRVIVGQKTEIPSEGGGRG